MKKITRLILGSTLLIASTFSFGGDNYRQDGGSYNNNDWSGTPWGRNNTPSNRNSNNMMPWSGNSPWGSDNPFWDRGSDAWRDWDTNKWGGNGMPWGGSGPWSGGGKPWGGNGMPWNKDRKYNRSYDNRGYGRPYGGGYGNPYQGGGYGGNPYQGYAPAPGFVPPPAQ